MMQIFNSNQDAVKSRVQRDELTGSSATDEDRINDIRFVIEQVSRFAWFYMIVKDMPVKKFEQDAEFLKTFYGTSHKQIVKKLNAANVSVYSIAFYLHSMLSHFRVYSDPNKGDPAVQVESNRKFHGGRALEEIVLWLLIAGQDCNDSNYTVIAPTSENGVTSMVYNGSSSAECVIQVPGIGISQTDPRNQDALSYCNSILTDLADGALPVHSRELLFSAGKYSPLLKPSTFLKRPLKWGGWPSPKEGISSLITIDDSDEGESDGEGKEEGNEDNEDEEDEEGDS